MMSTTTISAEEFSERRKQAISRAKQSGLDALLVCSRGGGTLDRYADVLYLTNYYPFFPYIPDFEGSWSARAHSFLVLPADGVGELIIDGAEDGRIRFDGPVTNTAFVVEGAVAALRSANLQASRVGLVGSDVMTLRMYERLREALPELQLVRADDILIGLRSIKSPAEIALLRRSSEIGSRMIEAMMNAAEPGRTHGEVVAAGLNYLVPNRGMLYNSFMASGRGGDPSRFAKSNFPTWNSDKRLAKGDWIRLGISGAVDGYMFDLARSKAIGSTSNRQVELFEAAISCIEATLDAIRPGATAGDLGAAGLGKQESQGFAVDGVFAAMGHGIGLSWDNPWLARGVATEIVPSMVLSIERTITLDGYLGDFEETVLITPDGYERITDAQQRFW
jgi:Xaa-Pro aminopeptidase